MKREAKHRGATHGLASKQSPSTLSARRKILCKSMKVYEVCFQRWAGRNAARIMAQGGKKRLEHNLLALASYCRPVDKVPIDVPDDVDLQPDDPLSNCIVLWPSRDLLLQVQDDALVLALLERKPPIIPVWRAFEQVNKRAPTLRLVRRVKIS
jgi:hypothetical protein